MRAAETDLSVTGSLLYGAAGTRPALEGAEIEHLVVAHVLQHLAGQPRAAALGAAFAALIVHVANGVHHRIGRIELDVLRAIRHEDLLRIG